MTASTPESLVYMVYVSSAVEPFSREELVELLETARENNRKAGITGMLLYKDGTFMQVIEGPRKSVNALHGRLERDPRHHGMMTLMEGPLAEREFGEWSMGFRDLSHPAVAQLPGFSEFLNLPLRAGDLEKDSSRCKKLLNVFKSRM